MTNLSEDHQVLKTDTRGRGRVPAERREKLLDEFERSGLSGVKFAALVGIKYATFAVWVQKRRKARGPQNGEVAAPQAPGVEGSHPIRLFEALSDLGGGLTIDLPGGARLRVDGLEQLRLAAELLRLLATNGVRVC